MTEINRLMSLADPVALFYMDCCASISLSAMLAVTRCRSVLTYSDQRDVFCSSFPFFSHPPLPFFFSFKQAHLTFSIPLQRPSLGSQSLLKLPPPPQTTTHHHLPQRSRTQLWEQRTPRPQTPPPPPPVDDRRRF